jgi:hypothetical protein
MKSPMALARAAAAGLAMTLTAAAMAGNPPIPSNVLVVDGSLRGIPEDGLSWGTAFVTIQGAVNAALASGGVRNEVWVRAGDYRPTVSFNSTPAPDNTPVFSIEIRGNIQVYGGFAGTETLRSQRNIGTNTVTILPRITGGFSGVTVRVYGSGVLDGVRIRDVGLNQPNERKFNGVGIFDNAVVRDVSIDGAITGPDTAIVLASNNARLENVTISGSGTGNAHAGLRIIGNVRFLNGAVSGTSSNGTAGIEVVGGNPVIRRVTVENCLSRGAAVRATPGTIFLNGTIRNNANTAPNAIGSAAMVSGQLIGSLVYQNNANAGLATVRNALVINSTIADNGRIGVVGGSAANSIIWGNGDGADDNQLAGQILGVDIGSLRYNIIQGWPLSDTNLAGNPLLDGTTFEILTGSPAIDSGSNALAPRGLFTDAFGKRRFAGTGTPSTGLGDAPRIDRGATEFGSVPTPTNDTFVYGDFDGNGSFGDGADIAAFNALLALGHPLADANADGVVDSADLTRFLELID